MRRAPGPQRGLPELNRESKVRMSSSSGFAIRKKRPNSGSNAFASGGDSTKTEFIASKSSRQRGLDGADRFSQGVGANQSLAQAMNAIRQGIVGPCHIDQFLELAFQRLIAFAQHLDLALNKLTVEAPSRTCGRPQFGQAVARLRSKKSG